MQRTLNRTILVPFAAAPLLLIAACGGQDGAPHGEADSDPAGPVEAAAGGVAEAAVSVATGRPVPREGLPDYVETAAGGQYMTGMTFSNELRTGGMVMYRAPGSAADAIAFHRASMERHGMTVGEAATRPVRDHIETHFEGVSADGRSSLSVTVIDKSEPSAIVSMNYADEQGSGAP